MSENTTSICIIDNVELTSVVSKLDKIRQFQDLIKSQMIAGQDYGVIPGTSKPTLFKPGAAIYGSVSFFPAYMRGEASMGFVFLLRQI